MQNQIHENVQVGFNFKIGHFCVIEEGVIIGNNARIENFVEIQKGLLIGNNVWIRSYARIGAYNRIEDYAVIKCAAITGPKTIIKKEAFIGPQVIMTSDHILTQETRTVVDERVFIGAGTILLPNIHIGAGAIIGAQSFVNKDCEAGRVYVGSPIRKRTSDDVWPGKVIVRDTMEKCPTCGKLILRR